MTMGRMANLLAVQEGILRLIAEEGNRSFRLGANVYLQDPHRESLHWAEATLNNFLEGKVRAKFGVLVLKKNIKRTMNASSATVGDLAIAVFMAIERQQRIGGLMLGRNAAKAVAK